MKNTQRKTIKSYISLKQRIVAAFTAVVMLAQICIPTIALGATAWGSNFESRLASELNSPMIDLVNELAAQEAYKGAYFIHKSTLNQTTLDSFYTDYPKGKPAQKPKFVGDSFVQSRLIRAQYRSLMGRYFFSGVLRSEETEAVETSRLYNNAKTYAVTNNLTLGNPLGNAAPAQDMIWPELKQINGKSYLVPIVHLSQNTLNNKVAGHLIEFDSNATFAGIQLDFATLVAGYNSTITGLGGIINNSGNIKSPGNLTLATNATFANMGGNITAAQNLSIYANDFYNKTLVVPYKDKNGEGTRLGAVAGISAQDGNLFIKAANNITFAGATADAGGTLKLNAAGDINILPVQTGGSSQTQEGHWKVNKNTTDLLMSRLAADDTLSLIASGVINITASELISTKGGIELLAGQGIHIIDELEQTEIQKVDRKGKTTGQSSEFRSEAVRAILKAGKGVLLDSERGDVVLKATEITSVEGTQVSARDGTVHLLMTKELEEFHLQTVKKGTWKIKTRTEDVIHENNIQNSIVGGFQVQAKYGINVEYTGKEGATLKEQIEEYRNMPDMKWMAVLYDQAVVSGGQNVNWEVIEEVHKELRKSKSALSPAAMAIIAIAVCVAMGPAGAGLIGTGGGIIGGMATNATIGAALNAGALTLATQAAQSLAAGNNLRETLSAMDSKESLKSLAISMATAGAMQHTSFDLFPVEEGVKVSTAVSIANQVSQAVVNSAVSAGISVAINGGNSDDYFNAFKTNLASAAVSKIGESMANKIGDLSKTQQINDAVKYIAHAGAGCVVGVAKASISNTSSSQGCSFGAGGAVIGEVIADVRKSQTEVGQDAQKLEEFLARHGLKSVEGLTPTQRLEYLNLDINATALELTAFKDSTVDLAKLGAALSAFVAGGDQSSIDIAAFTGENAAENNALFLIPLAILLIKAVDIALTVNEFYEIYEEYQRDPEAAKLTITQKFGEAIAEKIIEKALPGGTTFKVFIEKLGENDVISPAVVSKVQNIAEDNLHIDKISSKTPAIPAQYGYVSCKKVDQSCTIINVATGLEEMLVSDIKALRKEIDELRKTTNYDPQKLNQLEQKLGAQSEALTERIFKNRGYTLVEGGKLPSNQGIDTTALMKDSNGKLHVVVIDTKQIDGSFKLGVTNEGQQLSDTWINAKLSKMDPNSEAYKQIDKAQREGTLVTAVAGVDHKTGEYKIVPVNAISSSSGE